MHVKIATLLVGIVFVYKLLHIVWGLKVFDNLMETNTLLGMPVWFVLIGAAFGLLLWKHYMKK